MSIQAFLEEFDRLSPLEQESIEKEIHNRRISHRRKEMALENKAILQKVSEGNFESGTIEDFFEAVENETDLD